MFIETQFDLLAFWFITYVVLVGLGATGNMYVQREAYKKWYGEYHSLIWLPHRVWFLVLWFAMQLLVITSMYIFAQGLSTWPPDDQAYYLVPTVAILFILNLLVVRQWSDMLVIERNPRLSFIMIVVVSLCGLGILIVLGLTKHTTEMACFLPYVVWCVFLAWINWTVWSSDHHVNSANGAVQSYDMSLWFSLGDEIGSS
jgi:tryptophan-rich sensory protein